ncbi:hypothetical protein EDC04DRAFT_2614628 [Pisolithus marmoratus]|nr:hypothetical protein EDC04DRAFT_2614628 [Pisolithus marmoratus]
MVGDAASPSHETESTWLTNIRAGGGFMVSASTSETATCEAMSVAKSGWYFSKGCNGRTLPSDLSCHLCHDSGKMENASGLLRTPSSHLLADNLNLDPAAFFSNDLMISSFRPCQTSQVLVDKAEYIEFGVWADQLGGERATSILGTPYPSDSDTSYEAEVKGASRMPFPRSDSFAVLGLCIGFLENVVSNSVASLNSVERATVGTAAKPFTSAFAGSKLQAQDNYRARLCVLVLGNFEALTLPGAMFFFGGGQQHADHEGLCVLGNELSGAFLSSIMSISTPVMLRAKNWSSKQPGEIVVNADVKIACHKLIENRRNMNACSALLNALAPLSSKAALGRHFAFHWLILSDQCTIFQPLLDMAENQRQRLGVNVTFRTLEAFIPKLLVAPESKRLDAGKGTEECHMAHAYAARIESEKISGEWAGEEFNEALLLADVIKKIEADPATGAHVRAEVMESLRGGNIATRGWSATTPGIICDVTRAGRPKTLRTVEGGGTAIG